MNPVFLGTNHRLFIAGSVLGLIGIIGSLGYPSHAVSADHTDLFLGEAYFMSGSFQEAIDHLAISVQKNGEKEHRALYLLGRIYLLTGDFRQSKEFFERAYEHMPDVVQWRAQTGIGDALYGSGHYEEAIRRYRVAKNNTGDSPIVATIDLKIALSEMALGKDDKARKRMRDALERIPLLSPWSGNEEAFYRSLTMQGLKQEPRAASGIYVTVGPVSRAIKGLEDLGITAEVSSKSEKIDGLSFLRCGPFIDAVEAMIFIETVKANTSLKAEVQTR